MANKPSPEQDPDARIFAVKVLTRDEYSGLEHEITVGLVYSSEENIQFQAVAASDKEGQNLRVVPCDKHETTRLAAAFMNSQNPKESQEEE